jgi:four helix bundle protein
MNSTELKNRTKKFALSIIELIEKLPNSISGRTISNQIVRSGTSVGANYRAVCRARSDKEFIAKLGIVIEEADETLFWLEIIESKKWLSQSEIEKIIKESNELTSIFVSSVKTVKARLNKSSI